MKEHPLWKYLRPNALPHFFCPGCGAAQVLNFFLKAADETQLDFDNFVGIGGVGCAARIPVYMNIESLHGVHGRTIPWATGIKLHKPELKVVIFAGDGDATAIGGGHLIHACRRNLDVVMIVVNNLTFGMTGGQMAPTTPKNVKSATTPYGNVEEPFDICELAKTAGATYVARWTTDKPKKAKDAIKEALRPQRIFPCGDHHSVPHSFWPKSPFHRERRAVRGMDQGQFGVSEKSRDDEPGGT